MLPELRLLLAACPADARYDDYEQAIVEDNVLLKDTRTTRKACMRAFRELYALDPSVLLFHALRDLWDADEAAQPLLALLCAVARDPVLRGTASAILATPIGTPVTPDVLAAAASDSLQGHYKESVLNVIGRNAASSWQKSGHLSGRNDKVRVAAQSTPAATAYALLLGYLCGVRGERLFETLWSRLLDVPLYRLRTDAVSAARQGWLEYRHAGDVTDISFHYLLRDVAEERAA